MPGIASAATAVVIGYVAAGMMMICVGAGGLILVSAAINERAARLHSLAIVAQVRETVRLNC